MDDLTTNEDPLGNELIVVPVESVLHGAHFETALIHLREAASLFFAERVNEATAAMTEAETIKVTDRESYKAAAEFRSVCRQKQRETSELIKPMKERADQVKTIVLDAEKEINGGYAVAITTVDPLLSKFEADMRAQVEAERRVLEAQARKRVEKERDKQAADLLAKGHEEAAEALLDRPVPTPSIKPQTQIPKVEGQSVRTIYKARVINLLALVKAIAQGKVAAIYVEPNQTALDGTARALKEQFSIPGCELITETSRTSR